MTIQTAPLFLDRAAERSSFLKNALVVMGASLIISLFAHVSIPLPFTPVPIATQTQVILFLAAILGSRKAALATLCFLFQGMVGLPVFAGGKAGLLCLAGPTGGYLVGYVLAAYVTGYVVEKMKERTSLKVFLAMALGNGVIFALGAMWLSKFVGFTASLTLGVLPFLVGDIIKLLVALKGLKSFRFLSR